MQPEASPSERVDHSPASPESISGFTYINRRVCSSLQETEDCGLAGGADRFYLANASLFTTYGILVTSPP
jgi:hypothetical protein